MTISQGGIVRVRTQLYWIWNISRVHWNRRSLIWSSGHPIDRMSLILSIMRVREDQALWMWKGRIVTHWGDTMKRLGRGNQDRSHQRNVHHRPRYRQKRYTYKGKTCQENGNDPPILIYTSFIYHCLPQSYTYTNIYKHFHNHIQISLIL